MTTQAIKAVLFDFGNVLGLFDHLKACSQLAALTADRHTGEAIRQSLFASNGLATMFEMGQIDDRTFMRSVCRDLEIFPFDNMGEFEKLWGDIFTDPGIHTTLDTIKPFVKVGVLSNTDPIHWKYIQKLPVMTKHFTGSEFLTTSFEVKARKPDEKMYAVAAQKFGCEPHEIVFIDDLSANVEAAKSFGFHAERHAVRGTSQGLRDILSMYGVV